LTQSTLAGEAKFDRRFFYLMYPCSREPGINAGSRFEWRLIE